MQQILRVAEATAEWLRTEHGQIMETVDEMLDALYAEGVDAAGVIRAMTRAALDAKAMKEAADARLSDLRERSERFGRQYERWRLAIAETMEMLPPDKDGKRKFLDPEFTLSLRPGDARLVVTDVDALPEHCVRLERKPIMSAIKEWSMAGDPMPPGVELRNGAPVLVIRSK
jgi:hypothetical protein